MPRLGARATRGDALRKPICRPEQPCARSVRAADGRAAAPLRPCSCDAHDASGASPTTERVRPNVQRILDAMTEAPAYVRNGRGEHAPPGTGYDWLRPAATGCSRKRCVVAV